ncbi:serine beta-lactamase-like protein LACTB, mitochondrial [Narcine bancroftii]|uniref:serine beta-lactamase-like protein LACTB, mitochondrial n=1 Tax=Narcine bancroftii TaxID=1343680 RepID=UPI0038313495
MVMAPWLRPLLAPPSPWPFHPPWSLLAPPIMVMAPWLRPLLAPPSPWPFHPPWSLLAPPIMVMAPWLRPPPGPALPLALPSPVVPPCPAHHGDALLAPPPPGPALPLALPSPVVPPCPAHHGDALLAPPSACATSWPRPLTPVHPLSPRAMAACLPCLCRSLGLHVPVAVRVVRRPCSDWARATGRTGRRGLGLGVAVALGLGLGAGFFIRRSDCESEQRRRGAAAAAATTATLEAARDLLQRVKDETGAPGIVVGVAVDGKEVWSEGLGYADVENRVLCKPETVMRVASVSKSFTMTAIAKLWEDGKLDLDAPVQKYVPEFPEKEYEGEKVTITTRLLVSHLSGIRHYEKDVKKVWEQKAKNKKDQKLLKETTVDPKTCQKKEEFEHGEYYLKEKFGSISKSLKLFENDPLVFKPGSQFLYSTHAWTLLSAVVERASQQNFLQLMEKLFQDLDMLRTLPDEYEPIIYNRARYYIYNEKGRLVNCPYVDCSYKWAGGGFISTVQDLLKFGNVMLYSYQAQPPQNELPGYLRPATMRMIWSPVGKTELNWDKNGSYAMGWGVVEQGQHWGQCRQQRHYITHTGGSVGASSVLLILPRNLPHPSDHPSQAANPPRGVVVAILCNLQAINLNPTALKIALEFDKVGRADLSISSSEPISPTPTD